MAGDDPFKDAGKGSDDPFKDAGKGSDDPFKDAGKGVRQVGFDGGLGGGLGWAVVAFIGPVGVDVAQLAARMLVGRGPQVSAGPRSGDSKLRDAAARAQTAARKRAAARAKLERAVRALEGPKSGKPPRTRT